MLASARSVSSTASKSKTRLQAMAPSALSLDPPPTPRITQQPTLGRMPSFSGEATHAGRSSGLTMRDILPHRVMYENAIFQLLAGAGLGIKYNSLARDIGPSIPPPAPRLACSATLPDNDISRSANRNTVEAQALNALSSSSLYMRRRAQKPLAPLSTSVASTLDSATCPEPPLTINPKALLLLPASAPVSPAMSALDASEEPFTAGTSSTGGKPVGLGISSPLIINDVEKETIREDDGWEDVKRADLDECDKKDSVRKRRRLFDI